MKDVKESTEGKQEVTVWEASNRISNSEDAIRCSLSVSGRGKNGIQSRMEQSGITKLIVAFEY